MSEYIILNCEACNRPVVKIHKELLERIRGALHYSGDQHPHFYHVSCPDGFGKVKALKRRLADWFGG